MTIASRIAPTLKNTPRFATAINLFLALIFLMAILFHYLGFSPLMTIVGIIAFFTPGVNLSLTVEQLAGASQKKSHLLLWAFVYSLILTPAGVAILALTLFATHQFNASLILLLFGLWWALTLGFFFLCYFFSRVSSGILHVDDALTDKQTLLTIFSLFVVVMVINFLLYPFIPEADAYGYLTSLEKTPDNLVRFLLDARGLFLVFAAVLSRLLNLSPYWIFKVIIPLLGAGILFTTYLASYQSFKSTGAKVLASFSPFFFPVILQELLIPRPQSLFLLTLVPLLYLVSQFFCQKRSLRWVYWLGSIIAVGALGIKAHLFFSVVILIGFIAVALFYWPVVKKRPIDSAIIVLIIFVLAYPWIASTGYTTQLMNLLRSFVGSIINGSFTFWFIDDYKNVDGAQIGWSGISFLYYYGYNLGFTFPLLFVFIGNLFIRRKFPAAFFKEKKIFRGWWSIWLVFALFFLIAEIFPRFGLAYLPDRAWLFVAVTLAFLLTIGLSLLEQIKTHPRVLQLVALSCIFSLGIGTYVTYAKQGWITRSEYRAAAFIKDHTPQNAVFIGPGTQNIVIMYFSKRKFVENTSLFTSANPKGVVDWIEEQRQNKSFSQDIRSYDQRKERIYADLNTEVQKLQTEPVHQTLKILNSLVQTNNVAIEEFQKYQTVLQYDPIANSPIYIIYNSHKFNSLYGMRQWWKDKNAFGFDPKTFSGLYPLVYDREGIAIWEIRN